MKFVFIVVLCCFGFVFSANAQKAEKVKSKEKNIDRSNAFEPYEPEERSATSSKYDKKQKSKNRESFRSRYFNSLDKKKKEFAERMEANTKKHKKMEREMKKPQYSDPMYFGHKKKPKKRPVGKRKFCKECGIVH